MGSAVSFGTNVNAQRKRVYYFGTSTIYEGMPVCYDNSTTNVLGVDRADGTASTTTTEGSANEGKFLRVENPNADNVGLFAGVVAIGPAVGKTGPKWLEIFIPNGAVVPVRTDNNCLIDKTILAVTTGSQELGVPLAVDSRPVAIARETIDRGTAGLTLAQLCPDRFIYQDLGGTALSVDDADATTAVIVNRINVSTLQTGGRFTAFEIHSSSSGAVAGTGYGHTLYCQTDITGACSSGQQAGVSFWTNITGGTQTMNSYFGVEVGIYEAGAHITGIGTVLAPLCLRTQLDATNALAAEKHYMMYLRCDGADKPDGLFMAYTPDSIGMAAQSSASVSHTIPVHIQVSGGGIAAGTYYIMVSDTA